jgi:diguanylate cyclase (GGDEF)-like protein
VRQLDHQSEQNLVNRVRKLVRYLADASVVTQPRYRAWERRSVRTAARAGSAVVVVIFLIGTALMSSVAPTVTLLNPPMALVMTLLYLSLRWRRGPRRNPSAGALVLAILALTNSLLPLGFVSDASGILLAHVAIVIVASALFIPWNTIRHVAWLGICLAMVGGFIGLSLLAGLHATATDQLITITIDSVLISLAGHLILQRQRRGMYLQRMQLRGLNRLAASQARDLHVLTVELREAARVDPLTGVANRLRLEEDLEMVAGRDAGRGEGAALMIDIDRFKDYNDRHGHIAGDDVLRRVADALAANTRPSDRVYRFGGEEFLVLLPGASIIDALAVAERQRAAVAELGIRTDRPDRTEGDEVVTISVGVAPLGAGTSGQPAARADEWLHAADTAMYESKMNGRNRVTVARADSARREAIA